MAVSKELCFEYIQKVCNPRNPINYTDLLYKIKRYFSVTIQEIIPILQELIESDKLIVSKSKVYVNILANDTRRQIVTLIDHYPGIYGNLFMKLLKIGANQLLWHLSMLEEFGVIKSRSFGKIASYYLPDVSQEEVLMGYIILKRNIRNLLDVLSKNPMKLSESGISELIECPRATTRNQLKRLMDINIVLRTKKKEYYVYFLNPDYQNLVETTLERYNNIRTD